MLSVSKKAALLAVSYLTFFACEKKSHSLAHDTPVPPADTVAVPDTIIPARHTITIGSGTGGNLYIDGSAMEIRENSLIKIKAGSYRSVYISNIAGNEHTPVTIQNDGIVTITDGMFTSGINNVTISGAGTPGISHGIRFFDISYRAISMSGKMNGVTLTNLSFKNIGDYTISGSKNNGSARRHDGTSDTRTERFKILHCTFERAGAISFGGNLDRDNNEDSGFFKDVEIAYNTFSDTDAGTVCTFSNVQDFNIRYNTVNNINAANNEHNGIFFMQGNGNFHHNKLTNYQGNAIRMWVYSRGTTPDTVRIYNNICYNTRKYSGFELQGFSRNFYPEKSTFVHAKVYNNTVGRMNTSKQWEGVVLDLYEIGGGTLEYYNNLGFELNSSKAFPDMINNMSNVRIVRSSNNIYISSSKDAVRDLAGFISIVPGAGAL